MFMSKSERVRIAYSGAALDEGIMDINILAPALMSLGQLIASANMAIGGENKIRVLMNHDSINQGSFDITVLLDVSFAEQLKLIVDSAQNSGIADLMNVLGWGCTVSGICSGIFQLIQMVRGREIKNISTKSDNIVEIHLSDNETILTTPNTLKVYMDIDSRKHIEGVINPIQYEGISNFEIRDPKNLNNKAPYVSINEKEIAYFKAPPLDDSLKEIPDTPEVEITVRITSPTFAEGQKWKLTDGNNTFWATIEDQEFLNKVNYGELRFGKGDLIRIRYKNKQYLKGDKLSSEYIVTKVLSFTPSPKQIKLPFENN